MGAKNLRLRLALLEHGKPQYLVANGLGVSETRLSRIIQGRIAPTDDEKTRLGEILRVDVAELFGSDLEQEVQ